MFNIALKKTLDTLFELPTHQHIHFDSILSIEELDKIDYARNFPHLTCLGCALADKTHQGLSDNQLSLKSAARVGNTRFALLPATCFKVYLSLEGLELHHSHYLGCSASCFRNEDKALDDYRGLNFTMKEFVCVGNQMDAKRHIEQGIARVSLLFERLGIPFNIENAMDPFFDNKASQAILSKLSPTKREFVFDGHAVASANFHRNFFGEKLSITLNGEAVNTSCVAFGIERWLAMLRQIFVKPENALYALNECMVDYHIETVLGTSSRQEKVTEGITK